MKRISTYLGKRWEKHEKGDHLIEVLGTVVVAVAILMVFYKWMIPMFNSTTASAETKIESMFNTTIGGDNGGN